MRKSLFCGVIFLLTHSTFAQTSLVDSVTTARNYHERFNLINQFEGGDLSRYVYTHITEFFPNITLQKPIKKHSLHVDLNPAIDSFLVPFEEKEIPLATYIQEAPVDGLIVLHKGSVVFEAYPRMHADQKHIYMSVSKPFVSVIVGILEDRGLINVNQTIEAYIPELRNTAWDGIQVINILDMASGICWEFENGMDTFNDPNSCFMQFDASVGWSPPNKTTASTPYEFLQKMDRYKAQGLSNDYSSINTFVLSWMVEKVTGKRYTDLVETEIWHPMGAESDGLMLTPKRNIMAVYGGISSTLRDLGRFGLLFTPSGPKSAISSAYLKKIQQDGRPKLLEESISIPFNILLDGEKPVFSTYQWDFTMADGDFYKSGFLGQGLYISPKKDLVIAYFGTYDKDGTEHDLKNISRQLAKSELFK